MSPKAGRMLIGVLLLAAGCLVLAVNHDAVGFAALALGIVGFVGMRASGIRHDGKH